jgi:cell division protein FtsN
MSWSRLDVLTAVIVFICMGVLGLLVYKLVEAMNEDGVREKPQVEVSDDRPTEDEALDTWVEEDSSTYLDEMSGFEDLDDPDAGVAETGIAEEEIASAKQEKTWPAERPKPASVPSASRPAAADRGAVVSSAPSAASSGKTARVAPAPSPAKTNPKPAPVVIGPRAGNGGVYKVIAGAFKSQGNAESQASQLRRLGYAQTRVLSADNGIYRVMVQSFDNSADAARLERELETKGFGDCYVKAN